MRLTAPVVLTSLLFAGCAEWPRVANIPDPGPIEDPGVRPGDLVDVDFVPIAEAPDSPDQPVEAGTPQALAVGGGFVLSGTLQGVGWADAKVAEPLTDDNCPGALGTRSPLAAGDYIADVDFTLFDITEEGTLCAQVLLDDNSVGWDLIPHLVDPCGVPNGTLSDSAGEPVGVDLGGSSGGWAANAEAGARVALGFAGYAPTDDSVTIPYDIAVSLVPLRSDGSEGVCPTHPEAN